MTEKRPIDIKRDSGGTLDIGTPEDGGIVEMLKLNGRLIAIKERSVYELIFADNVDPERKNPDLPKATQRLLLKIGTETELFSRVFITAKQLLKAEFLQPGMDINKGLLLTLEFLQEIAAMNGEMNDYLNEEKRASAEYEDRKNKNLDHAIPSIPDLQTRCKTIFQKADQALQVQFEIIRLFYPDFGQSYYSKFSEYIAGLYGSDDSFSKFFSEILPHISLIREIRNCLEHRERTELEIKDFELQTNLDILTPTIAISYRGSDLPRTSLSAYLPIAFENLVVIFETLIAYLCDKKIKPNTFVPVQITQVPEERRRYKFAKYAFWSPLGEGGYFHQ